MNEKHGIVDQLVSWLIVGRGAVFLKASLNLEKSESTFM
jgi:hypothetical protein